MEQPGMNVRQKTKGPLARVESVNGTLNFSHVNSSAGAGKGSNVILKLNFGPVPPDDSRSG